MRYPQLTYRFGAWLVEPQLNRLSTNDKECRVEPRTMDVLEHLLIRAGEVVSANEILEQVWSGRYAEPGMVAKRISQLRHVFDDDAKDARYIATVPKRGYRAIAQVDLLTPDDEDASIDVPLGSSAVVPKSRLHLASDRSDDQIRSIAVLPLENLSGIEAEQYIAEGVTEEIITELGKLSQFRVISRTSVMHYKRDRPAMKVIAEELDVDFVIEGSVTREASRIRVTIQLIDALTDNSIWTQSFDRDISSVLALRSDLARAVASHLNLELIRDEQVTSTIFREIDDTAYDAYLRGLYHIGATEQFTAWAPLAIQQLRLAVESDPEFAEAWAMLALLETINAVWVSHEHFATVREYAEKALNIDSNLAIAYTALGYVSLLDLWDPEGAEALFKRAVQLNPNDPRTLQGYLINLQVQERTSEANGISKKLISVAPLDIHQRAQRVRYLYGSRFYERMIREADRIRVLDSEFRCADEAAAYHRLDRFEDSYRARIAAYEQYGESCNQARGAAIRGWEQGSYEGALRELQQLDFQEASERNSYWIHAQLGDLDKAFDQIEELIKARTPWLVGIRYHPDFDVLRLDPRFDALVESMKLPTLPDNPARMADVARLKAFRGRAAEAIGQLERVIAESPDDNRLPRWLESMTWALFAEGEYVRAVNVVEQVLENDVNRHVATFAHLLKASSYANLDRLDAARAALNEAQMTWPTRLKLVRDVQPLFLGGDQGLRDRYIAGLQKAGLSDDPIAHSAAK